MTKLNFKKRCSVCRKLKSSNEFSKTKTTKDGYQYRCKVCVALYDKEYRQKYSSQIKQKKKVYYRLNSDHIKEKAKKYSKTILGKKSHRKACLKWEETNLEKKKSTWKVYGAIRSGKLIKQPCEVCGKLDVHAHHEDYSKPLDVVWLCPKHHKEKHAML